MSNLIPFMSYVFVTTFTPGPNNIMAMSNAHRFGIKKTLGYLLGVFGGFVIIMLMCSYFNLLLFNLLPQVKQWMGLIGALYMLYLAVKIIRSSSDTKRIDETQENSFWAGLTLQFINPKVILYGITVISNFVIPYYSSHTALITFSLFLAFIGFLATSTWAISGVLLEKILSSHRKAFNILMGLMLVYSAISVSGLF